MFAGVGGFRTGLTNAGDFFMPVSTDIGKKLIKEIQNIEKEEGMPC